MFCTTLSTLLTKCDIPAQTLQHERRRGMDELCKLLKYHSCTHKKVNPEAKTKADLYQKSSIKQEHTNILTPISISQLRLLKSQDSRKTLLLQRHYCREVMILLLFLKKAFSPHNVQKRGFLHSLLLFCKSPDVKSKNQKSTEMVKWMHINKKRKKHCQLKCSFITESRVKHCTWYLARNRGDGKHYFEGGEKILCGNKFFETPGFKTMQFKTITEVRSSWRS